MLFYRIELEDICGLPEKLDRVAQNEYSKNFQPFAAAFFEETGNKCHIAVSNIFYRKQKAVLCAAIKEGGLTAQMTDRFIAGLDFKTSCYNIRETTLDSYTNMLRTSERNEYVHDCDEIAEQLNISYIGSFGRSSSRLRFTETVVSESYAKKEMKAKAESLLCDGTFSPEIERIFQKPCVNVSGHPVHYLIQTDDNEIREQIIKILVSALYQNNRIKSQRYCEIKIDNYSGCSKKGLKSLYEICFDGTITVNCAAFNNEDDDRARTSVEDIINLCEAARRYRSNVLTVFCVPKSNEKIKNIILENLGSVTLVPICEETAFEHRARAYLRNLARQHGVKADKSLYRPICAGKGFSVSDIRAVFDEWYEKRIKTQYFTQYAGLENSRAQTEKKPKGSAYDRLEKMVGLTEAKKIIHQVLDFHKARKLFRDKGINTERPAMHMVFTGNPGTAKTTVARLFAQIMKDNDLLPEGSLHEVGRADLVGKYVGWTADIVKKKFIAAMGGVLFIDEAYSLVDDRDGLYGDEAINTIVAEMENRRDEMIVIFAGYPDKMEEFLQKNPGLRSRTAFHIPFEDYNADELYQITELMAENKQLSLCDGVRKKLLPIYESAVKTEDFGNGRFVRNIFEKAVMKQASRLVAMSAENVTKADVGLLLAQDFDAPEKLKQNKRMIGF